LGEKPLYYAVTAEGLLFASEPKALLATGFLARTADGVAIGDYLRTGYVAAPRSPFAAIAKLEPGTRLVAAIDAPPRVEPFWAVAPHLAAPPFTGDFDAAAQALREALEHAVAAALVSDVPVGAFLSGGLDSTAMTAIIRQRRDGPLHTFTLGFDVPGF